ncbi:MAG: autotransporter-associated beta strand repeat-containing protein [Verrucomicrobiota bacterium]
MKPTRNPYLLGASLAALVLSHTVSQAAGVWDGTTGNFDVATNWDNDVVPGLINVVVNNGGTIQVNTNHTVNDILAGTSAGGTGTWDISAGTLAMGGGWFRLGTNATGEGTVNVTGGTLTTVGQQNIGEVTGGKGNVNVSAGTWNNNGDKLAVGGNSGAGNGGTGVLTLSGTGTINNNNELWIGVGAGGNGTMNISAGIINQKGWLAIGRTNGTGTLNMTGGTYNKTTDNSGQATIIGAGGSGSGTFNQAGGNFNVQSGETWVGEGNAGTWRMSGGAANLQQLTVGQDNNGTGVLTLQGAADGLTGTLANGGGTQVLTANGVTLGRLATSNGTINLDGGTLAVNGIGKGAGTGTFRFNGGLLRARTNNANFMGGLTNAFVKAAGANIEIDGVNGNAIGISQNLLTDAVSTGGGLTKTGAGVLTLSGANTYTGATTISGGMVNFRSTGALPGYTTVGGSSALTTIADGAGIGLGVGGPSSFTAADITAIRNNTSGKFAFAGAYTLGIDTTDATLANGNLDNTFTYADAIDNAGSSVVGFKKLGGNTLVLTATNNYTGGTEIKGGTLSVASIADGGTASSIGASSADSANLAMNNGGTLRYTGTSTTTNRGYTVGVGGGGINNANDLTFTGQVLGNGNGSFTKTGAGILSLTNTSGTNTLAAGNNGNGLGFIVNEGTVRIGGTAGSPLAQTNAINAELIVGSINSASSPGAAMEINGGNTTVTSYIGVGRGNGTNNAVTSLTLNNNAVVSSGNFAIGYDNGVAGYTSSPTVNFNGTSQYTDAGFFTLGESVNGAGGVSTVNVNDNASIVLTTTNATHINIGAAGASVMNQNGGSVSAVAAVTIARDAASTSSYNLNGGTLTAPTVRKGAGSGTFNFNGGTLKAAGASPTFVTGVTTLVKEGGAKIDSNGFAVTVDTALNHGGVAATDGGLTKSGSGTLSLNKANGYTGATTISGGTLALTATGSIDSTSGVSLGTAGTLDVSAKLTGYTVNNLTGSGNVIGALTISNSLAIGNSPGTIDFGASVTLGAASTFNYEVDSTLNLADLGNVSGDLNLNSSALNLIQLGSYELADKFTLFSYSGILTGEFASLTDEDTFTAGGGLWRINYDDTSAGLNGGSQSKFVTITAVPEPSSAALLGLVGAAMLLRRRRNS